MDVHVQVCGPVGKQQESFCLVNEISTVTLTASAPDFVWTPPIRGGGRGSLLSLPQSEERLRSTGLRSQKHPLNFQLTRRGANRNHLDVSHPSANRWSFQIQTQILTLHFCSVYRPTRKPGLRHSSKSRLDASGAPIKSPSKIHDWKKTNKQKKTPHRLTRG